MTGKEVLFKTLRHEETERPAWVPMAGVHAGFLKGYTADEVYQDADTRPVAMQMMTRK